MRVNALREFDEEGTTKGTEYKSSEKKHYNINKRINMSF